MARGVSGVLVRLADRVSAPDARAAHAEAEGWAAAGSIPKLSRRTPHVAARAARRSAARASCTTVETKESTMRCGYKTPMMLARMMTMKMGQMNFTKTLHTVAAVSLKVSPDPSRSSSMA